MSVLDLARPELLRLQPYSSARMEANSGRVWLNANELPWSQAGVATSALNRYPEPQPTELLAAMASLYGVTPDRIFVGRGSDEAIDLLTRAFCTAGASNVIVSPPTFGMYAVTARIQGAAVREVALRSEQGYAYDADGVLAQVTAQTRIVYLCNPNNPTGNAFELSLIERMATALRDRALLVVDEAYAEFSEAESAISLLARFDNLVVLRTLSKAHGLAGARIGVAIADAAIVELLRKIMPPYPLPLSCIQAALSALQPAALTQTQDRIVLIRSERERLRSALARADGVQEILASAANFLTVRLRDAELAYATLSRAGVIVRSLRKYAGLEDALRISIGTREENDAVVAALDESRRAA
jgi:histidinol-phosphate aminotransferase